MMVVSMDIPETLDDVAEYGDDGFTSIAPINPETESTEADTTYIMKQSLSNEQSKTATRCENYPTPEDILSKQLKEFITLQLDLIEYQQVKITSRDKQIMTLRNEKEQLEARICRMERRLALQKKQVDPDENQTSKLKPLQQIKNLTPVHTPTSAAKNDTQPYKQQLPVTVTSRNDREFRFKTYLRTNVSYLDMPGSKLLRNIVQPKEFPVEEVKKIENVSVPQWKLVESRDIYIKDSLDEDVTNDAFYKRHMKPELEEKKRKRWDLQHLRQQQQHQQHSTEKDKNSKNENLKGKNTTCNNNTEIFTSLFPKAENMMAVQISNVVPVCVFGYPVPAVNIKELELPWFSVAKREVQIRQAKEKLTKKTTFRQGYLSKKKRCVNTDLVNSH